MDPWAPKEMTQTLCGLTPIAEPLEGIYDALILAVAHDEFSRMKPYIIQSFCKKERVIYDLKEVLPQEFSDLRL